MPSQRCRCAVLCLMFTLGAGAFLPAAGAAEPPLLVKIGDVERLIRDVEALTPADSPVRAQVGMLRALVGGTAWLDPARPVVAGVLEAGPRPALVALVPYAAPNPQFQAAFGAVARDGYYLLSFPPRPGALPAVDPALEQALLRASAVRPPANLVLEIPAALLLARMKPGIDAALGKIGEADPSGSGGVGIPPDEVRAMMGDMLGLVGQAETLRLGMEVEGEALLLVLDVEAGRDTALGRLFVDPGGETRLMDFAEDMPLRFWSRAPEMSGMMEMAEMVYGRLYRRLGFDTGELSSLAEAFTGEMSGGMRLDAQGIAMRGIYVLRPGVDGDAYIEKTYLPFLDRYAGRTAALAAAADRPAPGALYERTGDSTVAGLRVVGLRMNPGALPRAGEGDNPLEQLPLEMRMAASGDLLLFASSDAGIADLAAQAAALAPVPAAGPTSRMEIDLGALFAGIRTPAPPSAGALPPLSGKVTVEVDMRDGVMHSRTRFDIGQLTRMMEAAKAKTKTP
ncbi:MAG: hypothetical protein JXP48_04805 [Acidobacteria bacterium]|nr:hypothetical protein [Acidobacteriota bacterium]